MNSDRALMELFAPDAEGTRAPARAETREGIDLPSIEDRAELLLRALHGERSYTPAENAAARQQILSQMAENIFADAAETKVTTNARRSWVSDFLEIVRDAFVAPFMVGSFGWGQLAAASIALCALVGAGWSGAWYYTARSANSEIAAWLDGEAKAGRAYSCASQTTTGFPFRIGIRCEQPKIVFAIAQSTFVIQAKAIDAHVELLHPRALTAKLAGPVSVSDTKAKINLAGNWARARVALQGTPERPQEVTFVSDGLQFYRTTAVSMEPLLTGDHLELELRRSTQFTTSNPVFDLVARIAGGSIPTSEILSSPFTMEAKAAWHDVAVSGPMPWSARLRDWQARGGYLDVANARLQQADASVAVEGRVGLDGLGLIDGTLKMNATGEYAAFARSQIAQAQRSSSQQTAQSLFGTDQIRARSINRAQTETLKRAQQSPSPPALNSNDLLQSALRFVGGTVTVDNIELGVIPPLF